MSVNKNNINIKHINQSAVSDPYCLDENKFMIKFDTTKFKNIAKASFGLSQNILINWTDTTALQYLNKIDNFIENVNSVKFLNNNAKFISSSKTEENIIITNKDSSVSSIRDADVAEASSNYIKQYILQQTADSLLTIANQAPSSAINLV